MEENILHFCKLFLHGYYKLKGLFGKTTRKLASWNYLGNENSSHYQICPGNHLPNFPVEQNNLQGDKQQNCRVKALVVTTCSWELKNRGEKTKLKSQGREWHTYQSLFISGGEAGTFPKAVSLRPKFRILENSLLLSLYPERDNYHYKCWEHIVL